MRTDSVAASRPRPNQLRALFALSYYPFRAMMRNVATFAFGFIFPVVFISVFGLIGSGGLAIRLGVDPTAAASPIVTALEQAPGATVVQEDRGQLDRLLRMGKLDAAVQVSGDTVGLELNASRPQSRASVLWVQSAIDRLNLQAGGIGVPRYGMRVVEVAGRQDRYIDFALPGQIGFALLSTAIFGTTYGLLFLKKTLVLKRLFATPVHGGTILLGQGLARLVMALLQAVVILGLGVIAFGFQLANGWWTFFALLGLSALGLIVFLGMGLLIAGRSNDENSASPLMNLVTLPQFLLSGVFFPTDVFPAWLRVVADNLPLSYFNTASRQIATEGVGLIEVAPLLVGLALWGAIGYVLAARSFKWV